MYNLTWCIDDILHHCGIEGDTDGKVEYTVVFERLADLIEPEERTCTWKKAESGSYMTSCGSEFFRMEADYGNYVPRYCPECGAKVEVGDNE